MKTPLTLDPDAVFAYLREQVRPDVPDEEIKSRVAKHWSAIERDLRRELCEMLTDCVPDDWWGDQVGDGDAPREAG